MRTTAILGLFALAILAAPSLLAQDAEGATEEADEQKGVQWTADYSAALETAKSDNKRLFLEFTATW